MRIVQKICGILAVVLLMSVHNTNVLSFDWAQIFESLPSRNVNLLDLHLDTKRYLLLNETDTDMKVYIDLENLRVYRESNIDTIIQARLIFLHNSMILMADYEYTYKRLISTGITCRRIDAKFYDEHGIYQGMPEPAYIPSYRLERGSVEYNDANIIYYIIYGEDYDPYVGNSYF